MQKFTFTTCPKIFPTTLKYKAKGFTLIEVLIVITIVSILVAIVTPDFYAQSAHNSAKQTIHKISGLIRLARNHAVNHQVSTVLCPSSSGKMCEQNWSEGGMIFEDKNLDKKFNGNDSLIAFDTTTVSAGSIQWTALRNFLAFSGKGISGNSAGSFIYCPENKDARFAHALIVSFSGKMRYAKDSNHDGIRESGNKRNIDCQ